MCTLHQLQRDGNRGTPAWLTATDKLMANTFCIRLFTLFSWDLFDLGLIYRSSTPH